MNPSSFETNKYNNIRSLVVDLWIVSQNIENNKSVVGYRIHGNSISGSWYTTKNIHLYFDNNIIYTIGSGSISLDENTVVTTGQTTISHNNDGKKSISVYLEGTIYSFGTYEKVSGTSTLPSIPRASTLSVNLANTNIGTEIEFTITRANILYTHTLEYFVKSDDGYHVIATNLDTNYGPWTIPTSLIDLYNDKVSGPLYFRLTTYNGETLMGSPQTSYITVNVPSDIIPSVSLAIDDVGIVPSEWGIWIKTKSKIHGILSDSGINGSTITSRSTNANGTNYTNSEFTTGNLQVVGNQDIVATVIDSRGRSKSDIKSIVVVNYAPPSINNLKIIRCNSDGTQNINGFYAKAQMSYSISSCEGKNSKFITIVQGSITKEIELTEYSGTITSEIFAGISPDSSYLFLVNIIDEFNSIPYSIVLETSVKPLSIFNDGTGVSIGEIAADSNLFNVKLATRFKGSVSQVVGGVEVPLGGVPTGVVQLWSYTEATIPIGYIKLEGQAVSRSLYPSLFALMGTYNGVGDGSTTFNVPDMRGRSPIGYDSGQTEFDTIGKTGGEKTHVISAAEMPVHSHGYGWTSPNRSSDGSVWDTCGKTGWTGGNAHPTTNAGSGNAHNNLHPYKAWLWIIKY